jgi:hypothetical protein
MGATPAVGELFTGNRGRRAGELGRVQWNCPRSVKQQQQVRVGAEPLQGRLGRGGALWLRCGGDPLLEL